MRASCRAIIIIVPIISVTVLVIGDGGDGGDHDQSAPNASEQSSQVAAWTGLGKLIAQADYSLRRPGNVARKNTRTPAQAEPLAGKGRAD